MFTKYMQQDANVISYASNSNFKKVPREAREAFRKSESTPLE